MRPILLSAAVFAVFLPTFILAQQTPSREVNVSAVENRILRGGSFDSRISNLSAAFRNFNPPVLHSRSVGFRVARTCK